MRAIRKSWIGVVLAILFGLSLFFFRGSSRYSNFFNSDNVVATISGTPISTTKFLRVLDNNISQFSQILGRELTSDEIISFQIHQLALQNLINNAVFENEFEKLNFIIDEITIAKSTKKRFPNLYKNNKINDEELNNFLRQQRLKTEDLVNIISYEERAEIFDNLMFDVNYPEELKNKINKVENQTRNISLISIPYDKITNQSLNLLEVNKNDSNFLDFIEENSLNYMSDELRDINYILINKKNYSELFIPSEKEIENYFNSNKNFFTIPERRSFTQFNFKSLDEANTFKTKISSLSPDNIIKYANENDIKFDEFEKVSNNQILENLSNAIFKLEIDNVSDIINTEIGYHLVILNKIDKSIEQNLNDVRDDIKKTLTNVELNNYFVDLKAQLNQKIFNGLTLNEIKGQNSLNIETLNKVSKNYETKNDIISAIVSSSFSMNKNFLSDVIDFNDDISFIINVNEIYPSEMQDIEVIYEKASLDYIKFKKIEYARNIYESEINSNNLEKINLNYNEEINNMTIKNNNKDLPFALIKNIFANGIDSINFDHDEENIYYVKINKVNLPNDSDNNSKINISSDLKNSFGSAIIQKKRVSLNDELITGLLSQYK